MLGALTNRTRVTTAELLRQAQIDAGADDERRLAVEPSPLCSSAPYDINVLPFEAKIKQRVLGSPSRNRSLELEITFCVRGVISPLLANCYFRRFLLAWQQHRHQEQLDAHTVNYADDFVICCRPGNAVAAMTRMQAFMARLGWR
jgi:hypothetical protein